MEECNNCLSRIKKQNKNKHEQSKEQKCFSCLNMKKYIGKNDEIDKYIDIVQSYYDKHKKNIDNFSLSVMWKKMMCL